MESEHIFGIIKNWTHHSAPYKIKNMFVPIPSVFSYLKINEVPFVAPRTLMFPKCTSLRYKCNLGGSPNISVNLVTMKSYCVIMLPNLASRCCRSNVDQREALENLDLILLCLDEIVDGGQKIYFFFFIDILYIYLSI